MKKLTRYHVLTALVVVMLMAVGGTLVASNMGFKLVDTKTFVAGNRNVYEIALPHNTSYPTSREFLEGQFDGTNPMSFIVYDNTTTPGTIRTQTISTYYGSPVVDGSDIAIEPGVGFTLQITATLPMTLVGSQNPTQTHATKVFVAGNRNRFSIALTPNTKWTTSRDVLENWFDTTNPMSFIVYDNTTTPGTIRTQTISTYYGSPVVDGSDVPLVPGVGFFLQITDDLSPTPEPYY